MEYVRRPLPPHIQRVRGPIAEVAPEVSIPARQTNGIPREPTAQGRAVLAEVVMGEPCVGIDLLGGPSKRQRVVVGAALVERGRAERTGRVADQGVAPGIKRPPRKITIDPGQGEDVAQGVGGDGLPGGGVLQHGEDTAGAAGAFERPGSVRPAEEAPALG